jgi:FKBP-type peptidyl-prolyl cis-trans isomerase SlyD
MANLDVVKADSKIVLDYTLSTEEEVVDSTEQTGPLQVILGTKQIHPAIEKCLLGRKMGESFSVWLDPSLAFGEWDPQLKAILQRKDYPQAFEALKVGDHFESQDSRGKKRLYRVTELQGDQLWVDGNHPLAGKTVELKAQIVDIL